MQFDEVAHDREAEAEPIVSPRLGRVLLAEAVEDVGQKLPMDALAGIVDDDAHLGFAPLQSHLDRASRGCELDRVDEQVRHDLLQADGIAGDHGGLRIEHEVEL